MKKNDLSHLLFAATFAISGSAISQSMPPTAPQIAPANTTPATPQPATLSLQPPLPLASLSAAKGPLRVRNASGEASISIPLSARETTQSALLHLVATNSISLLAERSQLVVRLNDKTVAQFALSSHQPELTADIRLPTDLLTKGYNALTFTVAQHSTNQCEDPTAPELWTEIDTSKSTLQLQTQLKPLTPTLADLDDLIDPRQQSARHIDILNAAHPGDDTALATGGLVAQGIALRLRYLPFAVSQADAKTGVGNGIAPTLAMSALANSDSVIIGTKTQLGAFLSADLLQHIKGSFLGIYPMPADPRRFLLIVSGDTDDQVRLAAAAFASNRLSLPRQAEMTITSLTSSAQNPFEAPGRIPGPGLYQFKQLGYVNHTIGDNNGRSAEVEINIPSDAYVNENAVVELSLNFSVGAKMRADSVINIYLNNVFNSVIPIEQGQSGLLQRYRIDLPLRTLNRGRNTLSFRPSLVSLVSDNCSYRQTGNLRVTFFDDSTVTLPPISHFTSLPDLKLLGDTGFPYTAQSDGRLLALQVTAHDSDTIGAAWSLLARIAQNQSMPLSAAQVTFGAPATGRQILLVGAQPNLPADALSGAPWKLGADSSFVSTSLDVPLPAPAESWMAREFEKVTSVSLAPANTRSETPPSISVTGNAALSKELVVMQYRTALASNSTTTLFTAANPADLLNGMHKLISPEYWSALNEDVVRLPLGDQQLQTAKVGADYAVGSLDTRDYLGFMLSKSPWIWYVILMLLLLILAFVVGKLIARYRKRNHDTFED